GPPGDASPPLRPGVSALARGCPRPPGATGRGGRQLRGTRAPLPGARAASDPAVLPRYLPDAGDAGRGVPAPSPAVSPRPRPPDARGRLAALAHCDTMTVRPSRGRGFPLE